MAKECTISSIPFLGIEGVAYYVITRNPDGGMCGETLNVTVNAVCIQSLFILSVYTLCNF